MPTGYTDKITDDMSLRDFVLICAHAFGAFMERRDSGVDMSWPECKPSTYHAERLETARAELAGVRAWTHEQADAAADAEIADRARSRQEAKDRSDEKRSRYERMLGMVREWTSPPGWPRLKEFMIEQIEKSISFDCWDDEQLDSYYPIPDGLTGEVWREKQLERLGKDVRRAAADHAEEVERVADRNAMIQSLRESVEKLED